MKQLKYRIEKNVKFTTEYDHKYTNDGSTVTAIISFLTDSDVVLSVSLVYTWSADADMGSDGYVDCSAWSPSLIGDAENIQLLSELASEFFKKIPEDKVSSSDPDEVVGEIEYFFETAGVVSE